MAARSFGKPLPRVRNSSILEPCTQDAPIWVQLPQDCLFRVSESLKTQDQLAPEVLQDLGVPEIGLFRSHLELELPKIMCRSSK